MSNVLIENYRGWDITFDTDREVFHCFSDHWDTESDRKSFTAAKKYIDDFIKDNEKFVPFTVENITSWYEKENVITISGIRKDGRFTYVDKDGKVKQFTEYHEKDYYLVTPENKPIKEELMKIDDEIKRLQEVRRQTEKLLKRSKTVHDIRIERYGQTGKPL